MYIAKALWTNKVGKAYKSIWLRESYWENGKVKTRNLLNLKNWSDEAINALQIALNADMANKKSIPGNSTAKPVLPKHISVVQGLSIQESFMADLAQIIRYFQANKTS